MTSDEQASWDRLRASVEGGRFIEEGFEDIRQDLVGKGMPPAVVSMHMATWISGAIFMLDRLNMIEAPRVDLMDKIADQADAILGAWPFKMGGGPGS